MAKKKDIPLPEIVSVTANYTFNWLYDKMYYFEAGGRYDIPCGLYGQIGHLLSALDGITNDTNVTPEEINDGNQIS